MDPGWQPDGQLFGEIYDSTCYQTRAHKIMHTARKEELVCLLGLVCNLYFVILLGLLLVDRLVSHSLNYIKEDGYLDRHRTNNNLYRAKHISAGRNIPNHHTGQMILRYSGGLNLSKFVSCVFAFIFKFQIRRLPAYNQLLRRYP